MFLRYLARGCTYLGFHTYMLLKANPLQRGKLRTAIFCAGGALQTVSLQSRCVSILLRLTPLPQLLIFAFAAQYLAPARTLHIIPISPHAG